MKLTDSLLFTALLGFAAARPPPTINYGSSTRVKMPRSISPHPIPMRPGLLVAPPVAIPATTSMILEPVVAGQGVNNAAEPGGVENSTQAMSVPVSSTQVAPTSTPTSAAPNAAPTAVNVKRGDDYDHDNIRTVEYDYDHGPIYDYDHHYDYDYDKDYDHRGKVPVSFVERVVKVPIYAPESISSSIVSAPSAADIAPSTSQKDSGFSRASTAGRPPTLRLSESATSTRPDGSAAAESEAGVEAPSTTSRPSADGEATDVPSANGAAANGPSTEPNGASATANGEAALNGEAANGAAANGAAANGAVANGEAVNDQTTNGETAGSEPTPTAPAASESAPAEPETTEPAAPELAASEAEATAPATPEE